MGQSQPSTPADLVGSWSTRTRHPLALAAGLVAASSAGAVLIGVALTLLFPGSTDEARRLVAVLVLAVAALGVVVVTRGWRRTATTGPAHWRHTGLLVVPAVVAMAPLALGLNLPAASELAILVVGYVATGLFEEVWHRGVVLDVLRRLGLRRSAVLGGGLFGLAHLANVAFGQSLAVSFAQAVGAWCFGIGYGILRWRTGAVWLLVLVHAVGDLMFKVTNLHGGLLWAFLVGHDTLVLVWGLWCLRRVDDDVRRA